MKYLLVLITIVFFSCSSPKQTVYDPHVPHPGDTKILLKNPVPLDTIEIVLFERGFTIDTKNKELGLITTKPRKLKGVEGAVIVRAQIKPEEVVFTGEFAINYDISAGMLTLKRTFEQLRYGGMNKSIIRESWHAMENVVIRIGGERIYTK